MTHAPIPSSRPIKLVVVGDGMVGKTCLLIAYTTGSFSEKAYNYKEFDNYSERIDCDGVHVSLTLWDTAGQGDYERLRPLSYPGTDGFLLCFCVDGNHSYENILSKWYPEVKLHCPRVPLILVGTKIDLRNNATGPAKDNFISKAQGRRLASKLKAAKYVECSAKELTGVKEVFEEAVRAVLSSKQSTSKMHLCTLL